MPHMETIMMQYHRGRKLNVATGKQEYEAPVLLEQKLPPSFQFNEEIIKDILAAPTLNEAVLTGAIRPRTVSECKALRDDAGQEPK
eukprot:2383221-Prymnesium_polylepis.1